MADAFNLDDSLAVLSRTPTVLDSWLRGPLRDWAESLLDGQKLQREGYLNLRPIREMWGEHLSGKRNWQHHLWTVLMFQAWNDQQGSMH